MKRINVMQGFAPAMKKALSLFLSLIMLLTIIAGLDLSVYAYSYSDFETYCDNCGAYWERDVIKEPTCTATGTVKYYCYYCERTKTASIAPDGHDWSYGETDTCIGVITYECWDCGATKTEKTTAYGHDWWDNGITKQPTCTSTGVRTYECWECGATKTEKVAKKAHSYKVSSVTKAKTNKNGKIVEKCSSCKKATKTTTIYYPKTITLSKTSYTYDGNEKKPSVTVKDSKGKKISSENYTVSYQKGRKNAGKYTVTIKFKGNYSGTVKKNYTIKKKEVKASKVTVFAEEYTGKAIYPEVAYNGQILKKDTDYKISKISNNKKVGTASVTLKMKGNYSGTIKKTFKIYPAEVKGVGLKSRDNSSITIKWNKSKGVDGYKIYRYNPDKGKFTLYKTTSSTSLKVKRYSKETNYVEVYIVGYKKVNGKIYESLYPKYYYNCIKPGKIKYSANCSNVGKIRVIFDDIDSYKNVQIQLCIDKSFNDKKYDVSNFYEYVNGSSDYVQIYNLSSNKNYYVRCREITYDNKDNAIYGPWGDAKKVYVQ